MAKRIIGLVIALLMICAVLVPIAFFCREGEEERYTIEEIEEFVQKTFFNSDGSLSQKWNRGGEIIEMDDGYCYNTQYPQYVFEKPTSFEVTLLKDVKYPDEYNYFLVEFDTTGYFVGPLIKSYNMTYLYDGFRIWPSPYKLLNIAPENRYMYMKKEYIRLKRCATVLGGEFVFMYIQLLDDGATYGIFPSETKFCYYSSNIDEWISCDIETGESGLVNAEYPIGEKEKRIAKMQAEVAKNPIDHKTIDEKIDLLVAQSEYKNVKRL